MKLATHLLDHAEHVRPQEDVERRNRARLVTNGAGALGRDQKETVSHSDALRVDVHGHVVVDQRGKVDVDLQ